MTTTDPALASGAVRVAIELDRLLHTDILGPTIENALLDDFSCILRNMHDKAVPEKAVQRGGRTP